MKKVGEILQKARFNANLELETIERETKIRKKYLQALEKGNYNIFPSATHIKGFLKNYSEYLGLNSQQTLAVFRREFNENERVGILPKGLDEPLNKPFFFLTNQKAILIIGFILVLISMTYLIVSYLSYIKRPLLVVFAPEQNKVFTQQDINIEGKADNDSTVTINNEVVNLNKDGSFSKEIKLVDEINVIVINAVSKLGKITTIERIVEYKVDK